MQRFDFVRRAEFEAGATADAISSPPCPYVVGTRRLRMLSYRLYKVANFSSSPVRLCPTSIAANGFRQYLADPVVLVVTPLKSLMGDQVAILSAKHLQLPLLVSPIRQTLLSR